MEEDSNSDKPSQKNKKYNDNDNKFVYDHEQGDLRTEFLRSTNTLVEDGDNKDDGVELGGPKFNNPCAELFKAFMKLDFHAMYGNADVLSPFCIEFTDNGDDKDDAAKNADADRNVSVGFCVEGRHLSADWLPSPNSSCMANGFLWGKDNGRAGGWTPKALDVPTPRAVNAWGAAAKFMTLIEFYQYSG